MSQSFSRLNHICYGIAAPLFYQHLTIKFWGAESLRKTVSELTEDGQGRLGNTQDLLWQLEGCKLGNTRVGQDDPATKDTFLEYHLTDPTLSYASGVLLLKGWSNYRQWERDWGPLAALVARLCYLAEIEFFVRNDFPISLQEAISQHHPKCQLKLFWPQNVTFSVPSLKKQTCPRVRKIISNDDFAGIDINLLRLKGLHTLSVQIPSRSDSKGRWIEIDEMLPFLFLAPNLKHLLLRKSSTAHRLPFAMLKQEWHNLAVSTHPMPVSSLHSISIGASGPPENILLRLASIADISRLWSLRLDELSDSYMLARLAGLFPNLERLFISTNGRGWRCPDLNSDDDIGVSAIRAFNPLVYLHLRGFRSAFSLNQIVQRHGPSLKGLIIMPCIRDKGRTEDDSGYKYPELDAFGIYQLAKSCPQLEELRLPIKRSMGSQEECEMYKAVGGFSNLHSLVLDLHFDPRPRPVDPMQEVEISVLQEIFLNAAMDEKLALQIWHLISSNQASRRLQKLRVVPFGLELLPNDEHRLVDWLSRSFLITRYNFQNVGVPAIREIGKREREILKQSRYQASEICIPERLAQIISDIWPSERGKSWEPGCSSFPLQPTMLA
ncbi:hypothetical protein N7471_013162 [Penicillium samsonianum]|uniref:uncharacterized protein n=1 Tax=Penicillium samsonianum TaxID=1882272 RepID=UPI00254678EB|nr:uncharacterized protein N7471_013162 [Penicillium samsonianum]KAJ6118542.1 hypothetical protein N7471_013162 [Penicillium samsonianum]